MLLNHSDSLTLARSTLAMGDGYSSVVERLTVAQRVTGSSPSCRLGCCLLNDHLTRAMSCLFCWTHILILHLK